MILKSEQLSFFKLPGLQAEGHGPDLLCPKCLVQEKRIVLPSLTILPENRRCT